MKKYLMALTIIIGFSGLAEAQFKGLGGLTDLVGGKEKNEAPAGDINSAQDRLMTDLKDVLGDVLAAQALIATAQGNAEKAAALNNTANKMKGGDANNDDIKGAVQLTKDTVNEQKDIIAGNEQMTAESKALYGKALIPYIKAVAKTAQLNDPIKDFVDQAQNSLKSIRNPMDIRKLKKTLDTGLFVGKNVPKLIITLGTSAKDLMTYAKKNELDTSDADDIEL